MSDIDIKLGANNDELKSKLLEARKLADEFGNKFKEVLIGIGESVGLAFGFHKIVEMLKESVVIAANAQDKMARYEAVLRATSNAALLTTEQLSKLGKEIQKTTGYTSGQVKEAAILIGSFRNMNDDVMEKTIRLSADMAKVFGGDLASNAFALGRALESPAEGMGLLQRHGIRLTAMEKDQIQTLIDFGRTAEAQAIIIERLGEKVGGAAESTNTYNDRLTRMQNNAHEAKHAIGEALLPTMEELVNIQESFGIAVKEGFETAIDSTEGFNGKLLKTKEYISDLTIAITNMGGVWDIAVKRMTAAYIDFYAGMPGSSEIVQSRGGGGAYAKITKDPVKGPLSWLLPAGSIESLQQSSAKMKEEANSTEIKLMQAMGRADSERERKAKEREERAKQNSEEKTNRYKRGSSDSYLSDPDLSPAQLELIKAERRNRMTATPRERGMNAREAAMGGGGWNNAAGEPISVNTIYKASMEGLTDLNKRITTSAASAQPEKRIENAVIEAGKKQVEKLDVMERVLKTPLENAAGSLKTIEQKLNPGLTA